MDLALRKAQILESMVRPEEALAWLSSCHPESAPASAGAGRLLREQAWIEYNLGTYPAADEHLAKALAMAATAGDSELTANLQVRRSQVLAKLGRIPEADQLLDTAEDYLRNHKSLALNVYYLQYRGLLRMWSNRFEEAVAYFEQARDAAAKRNIRSQVYSGLTNLAWCQYRLGNLDQAMALYHQALPLATAESRHVALGDLGAIFIHNREYGKAAEYFRQAAELARGRNQEDYSVWLSDLAITLCDEGKWDQAERVNQQALEANKKLQSAKGTSWETLNAARIAFGRGRVADSESLYRSLQSPQADPEASLEASDRLAQLYASTRRPEQARRQFEQSLAEAGARVARLREDANKLSYLDHLIELHQHYVDFLAGQSEEEAFAAAESSRARLLRERMNLSETAVGRRTIEDYEAAARDARVTFLSYWIAPERSYLWKITGTGCDMFRLPGEARIRSLVERYQAGLEKDRTPSAAAGSELFEILLSPVKPGRGEHFVIVPDGPLYGLNLETLPAGPDQHPWLEDATVMVTPSLELLLSRRQRGGGNGRMLLVADAEEWDDEFPKLPNAQKEIEGIEKSFAADRRQVLSGAAASPAGYQRAHPESFDFIHFDAHAAANPDAPLDSAIVLSREGDSGKLSVKDLLSMYTHAGLHAQLVTLSACHSAGARTYAGEGLVGLAWAFLQSGAGNVIAGLWNVSDYSSPRLMEQLYAELKAGKTPAEALHDAKMALIQGGKYAHPFYWGAFQLYAGAGAR